MFTFLSAQLTQCPANSHAAEAPLLALVNVRSAQGATYSYIVPQEIKVPAHDTHHDAKCKRSTPFIYRTTHGRLTFLSWYLSIGSQVCQEEEHPSAVDVEGRCHGSALRETGVHRYETKTKQQEPHRMHNEAGSDNMHVEILARLTGRIGAHIRVVGDIASTFVRTLLHH